MKKLAKIIITILCLSSFTNVAVAALPGFYVGAGIGGSTQETPNNYIFSSTPSGTLNQSRHAGGLGGRIFAGFNFNKYFGLEAFYARFNDSTYKSTIISPPNQFVANLSYTMNTYNLVGKAYLPLMKPLCFNLYVLGGAAYVNSQSKVKEVFNNVTINSNTRTNNKFRPVYGLGASYDLPTYHLTASLEFAYTQGEGSVDVSVDGIHSNSSGIPNSHMTTFNLSYDFC